MRLFLRTHEVKFLVDNPQQASERFLVLAIGTCSSKVQSYVFNPWVNVG